MSLIAVLTNDETGTDQSANYRWAVSVNGQRIFSGTLKGHNREDGPWALLAQLVKENSEAHMVRVGTLLHGYCEGYFGRGGLGPKRVEGIGADWIVARVESGYLVLADFSHDPNPSRELEKALLRWEKVPPET